MSEQIFFTKEIIQSQNNNYFKRWTKPKRFQSYDANEDNRPERYCPRCDDRHKNDCNLIQMIIEFDTNKIQSDTNCSITFVENIKLQLWNRNIDEELGNIHNGHYYTSISQINAKLKQELFEQQTIPIETSTYRYIDNVTISNFNLKLFADSFADDELESFRSNVDKFLKIFNNIYIENHIDEIKYLLVTEYKNSYIQKQDFLAKHKPEFYKSTIDDVTTNMKRMIIYNNLSSKSTYISNAIITKLITLYIDFKLNPLFEATQFNDQKPNPHISKKTKNK